MDFTPGLELVRHHLRTILLVALIAGAVAYLGSFLLSPKYVSTTRLLVRVGGTHLLTATGQDPATQPVMLDPNLAKSIADTDSALVQNRAVAQRVVRDLQLDQRLPNMSLVARLRGLIKTTVSVVISLIKYGYYSQPSKYEGAVQQVQANLKGTPLKDSYLIEVRATADNGPLAAAMADSATKALVAVSQDRAKQEADAYRNFLSAQVDRARRDVQAADEALREYKQAQGIASIPEQQKLSADSQETLRLDMRDADVGLAAARAQQWSLQQSLASLNQTQSSSSTVQTGRSSTTLNNVIPNPTYQELQATLATVSAQVASLQAKRDALLQLLRTPSGGALTEQEATVNQLELQQSAAVDAYKTIEAAYDGAILTSAQGAVELSPVDTAAVPLFPSGPLRYLFLLVGILCGAAAGAGLGYRTDQRQAAASLSQPSYAGARA